MRYRCLILDHDDTAVDSTRVVHYPAHLRAMEILRPGQEPVSLETWFAKNFDPGILGFLVGELGFSKEEMATEEEIWRQFTATRQPRFYPGFFETIERFQRLGGKVVVASHSEEGVIRGHYRAACNGSRCEPDLVFGWELGPGRRKPDPYPVQATLEQLGLEPHEVLVVDDLKPGIDMALAAGVDAAAAGWSHQIPSVQEFMQKTCVATFATVAEFSSFVLDGSPSGR